MNNWFKSSKKTNNYEKLNTEEPEKKNIVTVTTNKNTLKIDLNGVISCKIECTSNSITITNHSNINKIFKNIITNIFIRYDTLCKCYIVGFNTIRDDLCWSWTFSGYKITKKVFNFLNDNVLCDHLSFINYNNCVI